MKDNIKQIKEETYNHFKQNKSILDSDLYKFLDSYNLNQDEYQIVIDYLISKKIQIKSSSIDYNNDDYSIDNALQAYYKDMAKYKLLSKEEEIELANKIQKGDNQALDIFVNSNLRLVINIAKDYKKVAYNNPNLSFEDIISYGNDGLLTAAKKFDPSRGMRFSTMAYPWIKQAIVRGINTQGNQIKLPSNIAELKSKIKKASDELYNTLQREPTYKEIANKIGGDITEEKVEQILSNYEKVVSLDTKISSDDSKESTLESLVSDNTSSDILNYNDSIEEIGIGLNNLNEREKDIVSKRFGLNNNSPMTLDQIGKEYNISKERVRQLLDKALQKMKQAIQEKE
jgi:RNA polymerase primary sigma factor